MQTKGNNSPPGMRPFWRLERTWEDNIKVDHQQLEVRMWAGLFRPAKGPVAALSVGSCLITKVIS